MTVQERLGAFGDWSLTLSQETPDEILDALKDHLLGTIYITPSRIDPKKGHPKEVARYAGIYRKREFTDDRRTISGCSLLLLLGDGQGKGSGVDLTPIDLTGLSFEDALTAAIADTDIQVGNIIPEIGGLPAGVFYLQDARHKVEEITKQFAAEFRITPKAQLDAGTPASLYPTFNDPVVFIKRGAKGVDPDWKPLPIASSAMGEDLINWANQKIIAADQDGTPIIQGQATISSSKRGPNGTLLEITSVSADSQVGQAAADSRAAALLALENAPRKTVSLSTDEFDVDGTVGIGDTVTVWNPEVGFYDETNHITVQGEHYFPLDLRVFGLTWPITKDMGVYLEPPTITGDDDIFDLSPYLVPESGSTDLEVGAAARKMVPSGGESLGPIVGPVVNPGAPPGIPDPPSVFGDERTLFVVVPTTSAGQPQPTNVTTMRVYASTVSGFTPDATNYIGQIPVSKANITLGQNVRGAFEWFIEDLTYVRVTAVNQVEGPASIEVSDAATLIPSAAILNLVADKIDAGTISASVELTAALITGGVINGGEINGTDINGVNITGSVITGGTVQSALSGQRVAISNSWTDQIRFYSGDVAEDNFGQIGSFVNGAGGTRRLQQYLRTPMFIGGKWSMLDMRSGTQDDTGGASAVLSVRNPGGIVTSIAMTETSILDSFGAGYVSLNASAIDLSHNSGGRLYIDDVIEFITGGSVRGSFDFIPGGGSTGDTALNLAGVGVGTKRLIIGAPNSFAPGLRAIYTVN